MKFRYLLLAVAGLCLYFPIIAQDVVPSDLFTIREFLLESMASSDGESPDFEAALNELDKMQQHPLDLNRATREELQKLFFLTDFQITSLLEYRQENGVLLSIYELQLIYGFTDEIIGMMLPFVQVMDQELTVRRYKGFVGKGRHEVLLKTQRVLEKARGYEVYDSLAGKMNYPGSPWLLNGRYVFELRDQVRAGITVEKDPGEEFLKGSNRQGFDFHSAFMMIQNMGPVKSAILGDYRLAFGQGLTLWSGAAPGKSSLPLNVVKRQDAIKAFTSNDENNFFRGTAATAMWGKFNFTGFFSSKKRDANITDTLAPGYVRFSSFQESGHHRTLSETADEKSLRETAYGGNIVFRNNYLKLGSTLACYHFDKYAEAGNELKDVYDFKGNNLVNWGIDYTMMIKKIQLFGETAYGNHYWATLNGMLMNVNKYASFSLLYRHFSSGFLSLKGSAFSENSSDSNEEGFYAGIVIHPVAKMKISGYADFYRFPWLKSGLSAPASGSDYVLQIDYSPGKQTSMYLKIKYETDPVDEIADSQVLPEISEQQHTGIRYHISYRANRKVSMQNRFEVISIQPGSANTSQGMLFYHDVRYKSEKLPLEIDFRLAYFNTSDYASRIYAYEHDLSIAFSFSPMYEKGFRSYIMARFDFTNELSFWIRLANTYLLNKQSISSGLDKINSPSRTDLKLQFVWRF